MRSKATNTFLSNRGHFSLVSLVVNDSTVARKRSTRLIAASFEFHRVTTSFNGSRPFDVSGFLFALICANAAIRFGLACT
jgi:hypothetical protein